MSKRKDKSQKQRFTEAAREHECDESEEAFADAMRQIAKGKPLTDNELKEAAKKARDDK